MRLLAVALAAISIVGPSVAAQALDAALEARRADQLPGLSWLFRVNVDGGVSALGTFNGGFPSGVPTEGSGTRMMWYPGKAAFRAGYVNGTQWDDANIGLYSTAFGENVRASGDYGVALGRSATAANTGTVAVGENVTATGANSVVLGYYASSSSVTFSPRQGTFVFGDRSTTDLVHAGSNHQATWRTACGFRVFTSSNLTTGVAFGGASVSNVVNCPTEQFGQSNTMIATSTGAFLSTSGIWQNASDVNRKHRFAAVDGEDVLARLREMPVRTWGYRTDPDAVRHMGPTAQDFRRAFGLGQDSVSIGTVDADGVALAAVQALEARTRALADENAALRARLAALEGGAGTPAQAALPMAGVLVLLGLAGVGAYRRRSGTRAER